MGLPVWEVAMGTLPQRCLSGQIHGCIFEDEKPLGLERCVAAITIGSTSLDTNFINCLCVTTVTGYLLWRSGGKPDALNSMAQEKPDYCRTSPVGTAKYFRQCSG